MKIMTYIREAWEQKSLRYIYDRLTIFLYKQRHPHAPWLTQEANALLAMWLRETDSGVEFGAGRSTLWFGKLTASLASVEHNPVWYQKVSQMLEKQHVSGVTLELHEQQEGVEMPDYVRVLERFPLESIDFVLVDGVYRDSCALEAIPRIRPGGLLIIDNVNRYLPNDSRSPDSLPAGQDHASPKWAEFGQRVQEWRCFWSCSGLTDTAIYIKPCKA